MSKANLITIVFVVLALAGMAVWMMDLEARQHDGTAEAEPSGGAPDREAAGGRRLVELEQRVENLGQEVASQRTRLSELDADLGELRLAQESFAERLGAPAPAEADATAAPTPIVEPDQDLRSAIEAVLTAREEEQQRRRSEERSRRFAGWLVSGLDLAQGQRTQVEQTLIKYMSEREKIGERYSGDNPDTQGRDADIAALDQRRNDELIRIVGSANFSKMEERLNRIRGGRGRGRRPNRGR
jgi:hypothetical protein